MKIPKYKDIDPELRKIDLDDLFDLLMCDFATHDIKSVVTDLVIYIKKSGADLSKELLALSKHPHDYELSTRVAKRLCRSYNNQFFHKLGKQAKADPKREDLPKVSEDDSYSTAPVSEEKFMNQFRDKLVNLLKSHNFIGLDLIGVDNNYKLFDLGCNSRASLGPVDLGIDSLKFKLISHILSNEGRDGGSGSSGFPHGGPDNPTPEDPVDQAVDILNQLGL